MPKESHPSLAEVQSAFEAWRKHRPTRSTPPALRAQAVGLLAHHRISEVMNALHVDHRRLSSSDLINGYKLTIFKSYSKTLNAGGTP